MENKPELPAITAEEYYTLPHELQIQYDEQIHRKINELQYVHKAMSAQEYEALYEEEKLMYDASCRRDISHRLSQIPMSELNPPKPNWFQIKWWQLKEWYYHYFKAKYYIARYQTSEKELNFPNQVPQMQKAQVVEWTKYLVQERTYPYAYTWQEKPIYCYKPFWTILIVRKLNKTHPEFQHSAIDINQYHWMDEVMNGPMKDNVIVTTTPPNG